MNHLDPRPLLQLSEPHRWLPANDRKRHAVPAEREFEPDDELTTYCGARVVPDYSDVHHQGLHKECPDCDGVVRELLEMPPWQYSAAGVQP